MRRATETLRGPKGHDRAMDGDRMVPGPSQEACCAAVWERLAFQDEIVAASAARCLRSPRDTGKRPIVLVLVAPVRKAARIRQNRVGSIGRDGGDGFPTVDFPHVRNGRRFGGTVWRMVRPRH